MPKRTTPFLFTLKSLSNSQQFYFYFKGTIRNTVLLLLQSYDVFLLTVDGCNNYTILSEADRAQGHMVFNDNNYRCDRYDLVPGWYRFQGAAGDQMADRCVPMNHCGTEQPGWLSDTHPTVAEGVVTRKVCYRGRIFEWHSTCCYYSNNIRVRNCGAFFVYELQKPPICSARYCGNSSAGKLLCFLLWVCQSSISHQSIIIIIIKES